MADTKISPTIKFHKSGLYSFRRVTKRRHLYGELRTYPDGRRVYWAIRKPDEIYIKTNSWAIDVETINTLKTVCIKEIGIEVNNGDKYLTTIDKFTDESLGAQKGDFSNHIGRNGKFGALQWYLPIRNFQVELAPVVERTKTTAELMRV